MAKITMTRKEYALNQRVEISRMYVKGFTQTEIAVKMKLSQTAVSEALKAIREQWLETTMTEYSEIKAKELAKIDNMESVSWQAWERSCLDATQEVKKVQSAVQMVEDEDNTSEEYVSARKSIMTPIKEHFETLKRGRDGNPAFLDRVAWCIEMRLKIFGILKEDKREVNQTINFNFDALVGEPNDDDPIEQKIIEVQALPDHNPPPSTNGTNGAAH